MEKKIKLFNGTEVVYNVDLHQSVQMSSDTGGNYELIENAVAVGSRWYSMLDSRVKLCPYLGVWKRSNTFVNAVVDIKDGALVKMEVTEDVPLYAIGSTYVVRGAIAEQVGIVMCDKCGATHILNTNNPFSLRSFEHCPNCVSSYKSPKAEYHTLSRKDLSQGSRFKVGMEVEKEDRDVLMDWVKDYDKMHKEFGWCVESDGSLNGHSGFEAVSPILDLFNEKQIEAHLNVMQPVLNAAYSKACGGHIHVSDIKRSPTELFNDCQGYFALLYALYPQRAKRSYSLARPKNELRHTQKNAVMLHGKTLEFRIFPSPKNIDTQRWRLELLRIILKHPAQTEEQVLSMMTDTSHELFKHISTGYATADKYIGKIKLMMELAKQIEGIELSADMKQAEKQIAAYLNAKDKKKNYRKQVAELSDVKNSND